MASQPQERPYRSHHQPACVPCRKRKSRCKLGPGTSATCLMCEVHGSNCVFPSAGSSTPIPGNAGQPSRAVARKARVSRPTSATTSVDVAVVQASRAPISPGSADPASARITASASSTTRRRSPARAASDRQEIPFANVGASPGSLHGPQDPGSNPVGPHEDDEAHVIGPVHSPDAQLIQRYLMRDATAGRGPRLSAGYGAAAAAAAARGGNPQRPVMFSAVRRHPLGRSAGLSAAGMRLEVVEKLLEPYADNLMDL